MVAAGFNYFIYLFIYYHIIDVKLVEKIPTGARRSLSFRLNASGIRPRPCCLLYSV